jgi:glycerol uptake facilitator-like aquaporin
MLRLQSNVPLPKTIRPTARGKRRKYPFEAMQIGSFFFVPGIQTQQIYGHVWNTGKRLGKTFRTRLCYMREVKGEWQPCEADVTGATLGVGVWRVA